MNNIVSLEGSTKRGGGGVGLLIVAALAAFALTRKSKAAEPTLPVEEIVPEEIQAAAPAGTETLYPTQSPTGDPHYPLGSPENPLYAEIPGGLIELSDWYDIRNIQEVLGWTREEFLARLAELRTLPKDQWTWQDFYADGQQDTVAGAQRVDAYYEMNKSLGGTWTNGVITPPSWWTGSVTGWVDYISQKVDETVGEFNTITKVTTETVTPEQAQAAAAAAAAQVAAAAQAAQTQALQAAAAAAAAAEASAATAAAAAPTTEAAAAAAQQVIDYNVWLATFFPAGAPGGAGLLYQQYCMGY